jgi:ferredoxin
MVLYFSGTGNSRYAAQMIGKTINDQVVSMNELMKKGDMGPIISERPFVFVCPNYAWQIPKSVEKYIERASFEGSGEAYFVMTCGEGSGNAIHYIKCLCKDKGFDLKGLGGVVMPINHIVLHEAPDPKQAQELITGATGQILNIANRIKAGEILPKEKVTAAGILKSSVLKRIFYIAFISAKGFYSTSACIGCGRCKELCPLNNIEIIDGKPQWGQNCTHCMACICGCPKEAIEYRNRTEGKARYYNAQNP